MDFTYCTLSFKIIVHREYLTGRELGAPRGKPCAELVEGNVKTLYYM